MDAGNETVGAAPLDLTVDAAGFEWVGGALILKEEKVDEFTFVLPTSNQPNPRLASLDVTDQGSRKFQEFIEGNLAVGRPEESHEIRAAWLLGMAGFQVISSGLRSFSMGSAPDAFAFVPFSKAVLVTYVLMARRTLVLDLEIQPLVEGLQDSHTEAVYLVNSEKSPLPRTSPGYCRLDGSSLRGLTEQIARFESDAPSRTCRSKPARCGP